MAWLSRQIGIMRDRDNEMDNFPAFAYSPSEDYMYTSPSAGPDFSGLFSIARNVYHRQVLSRSAVFLQLFQPNFAQR